MTLEHISTIAQCVAALGIIVAAIQLFQSKRQAVTRLEDDLQRRYFEIASDLPVQLFLAQPLDSAELEENLRRFYSYFHLCNHQISLRRRGKVTAGTWEHWANGMRFNFGLPAFGQAWERIEEGLDTEEGRRHLGGLKAARENEFRNDPRNP